MRRLALASGLLAAVALAARRRGRERVALRFDDGSHVSLDPGTPAAERVLAAARAALGPA